MGDDTITPREETINFFVKKFDLDITKQSPIEILNINRPIMANTLAELGYKVGVEVGVAAGDHSELLCRTNPGLKLYCVDPWTVYPGYDAHKQRELEEWYRASVEKLEPYNCRIMRMTSMEAVKFFNNYSLDFVYIDGDHDFKAIAEDVSEWIHKVRPGGILFGHDFELIPTGRYRCHVRDVVEAYAHSHNISPWFALGRGGKKPDGMYKEGARSWMFVL